MAKFSGRLEKSISIMYGEEDLSKFPLFHGGFINYGYWEKIPAKIIKKDRIEASKRLYEKILDRLLITPDDTVLEVGCGLGLGCVLALDQYKAKDVCGLDATPEQIQRCRKNYAERIKAGSLHFFEGFASKMPFADNQFSKALSVEAAQHFPSLPSFFGEAMRVLQPKGSLVFTTFFRQEGAPLEEIGKLIPTVEKEIDFFHAINECVAQLKEAGFHDVTCQSIGAHVWKAFDKWHEIVAPNDWGRGWFKVYKKGLIDYYVVEGVKGY